MSPATGEHAVILRLQNTATQRCAMSGYPATTLSHDRRPLPFVYQDGGGPYMGRRSPPSVVLGPGDDAYVLVAKYRCDGRDGAAANRLTFAIPHVPGKLTVTLNRPGVGQLSYCIRYPGDAAIDPGDRVAISPIEPTLAAVYALQQAA